MGRDIYTADRDTADTDPDNMEAFKGKYERTSADKYEELLKELDVNFLLRKAATVSTPVMEVTEEGGVWTIKTSTTLKTMELLVVRRRIWDRDVQTHVELLLKMWWCPKKMFLLERVLALKLPWELLTKLGLL